MYETGEISVYHVGRQWDTRIPWHVDETSTGHHGYAGHAIIASYA